jgi:C1A family cysteine protease
MKSFTFGLLSVFCLSHSAFAAQDWTFSVNPQPKVHAKGLKRTVESLMAINSFPKTSFVSQHVDLPNSYSLQSQASPVEDQGTCGSCWDFSLTGTLRDTYITVGPGDPGRLSFNYLLKCSSGAGCMGGDFDAASAFVSPKGAPSWATSPYTGSGLFKQCIEGTPIASIASYTMLGGANGPSFKDIATAIAVQHLPVSVDVAASGSWENYSSGVYNGCDNNNIDHMVIAVGYDCEGPCNFDASGNLPPGQGTYTIKNSWGTSWGQSGYITTKATDSSGAKCNAVATDALIYTLAN